jgi:glycine/D-amino acid oxidase-like deaminating enzyme
MASDKIRVAIIGGGLAGATLANALYKVPHIAVDVFESAPEFSERGAAVGLSTNAQAALRECVAALDDVLKQAGSVPIASTRLMIVSEHKGTASLSWQLSHGQHISTVPFVEALQRTDDVRRAPDQMQAHCCWTLKKCRARQSSLSTAHHYCESCLRHSRRRSCTPTRS